MSQGTRVATLPWNQGVGDAIGRTRGLQNRRASVPGASTPSHLLGGWVLPSGLLTLPALLPPPPGGPTARSRPRPLSQLRCRLPGARARLSAPIPGRDRRPGGPQSPAPGRRRPPRGWPVVGGGWPEGRGRGPGAPAGDPTQTGRWLTLPGPRPPPPPPLFPAPTPPRSTSGRSEGWLVGGGEVSPGGRPQWPAGQSRPLRWPDVRACVGGPERGQRVPRAASGVWGGGRGRTRRASSRGAEVPPGPPRRRGQKAAAGRGDRAGLGLDGGRLAWRGRPGGGAREKAASFELRAPSSELGFG